MLLAANGSKITIFGWRAVMIDLPQCKFKWTFVIADVAQPLLGADFLKAHSFLVDMKHQHLVNKQLFTSIPMEKAPGLSPQLNALSLEQNAFAQLLAKFPANHNTARLRESCQTSNRASYCHQGTIHSCSP